MKLKIMVGAVLLGASLCSLSAPVSVDVVPYMGLVPGKWAIISHPDSPSLEGYVVSDGSNGQVVQTWYRNDGAGWVFDSSEVFEITPTDLLLVAESDGKNLLTYQPPVKVTRSLAVNRPVFYRGLIKNQTTGELTRAALVLIVTATGLNADVPAGSFADCIKLRHYAYSQGRSRDSVSLSCSGRNQVKEWHNKIADTSDPQEETQSASTPGVMVQYGDASPPLP